MPDKRTEDDTPDAPFRGVEEPLGPDVALGSPPSFQAPSGGRPAERDSQVQERRSVGAPRGKGPRLGSMIAADWTELCSVTIGRGRWRCSSGVCVGLRAPRGQRK
jgi:hypothetical protein